MDKLKTPFTMLIVGMTGCGKTQYLLEMLERDYMKHFEYIFLICPTFSRNKTYLNWPYIKDKNFIVIECKQDDVKEYISEVRLVAQDTNSLLTLDDCAGSSSISKKLSNFTSFGMNARHDELSSIVISQSITAVAWDYRGQLQKIVTFYMPDSNDQKIVFNKFLGGIDVEESRGIINKLKTVEYARLEILLCSPYIFPKKI